MTRAQLYDEEYARRYFEYDAQACQNPVGVAFTEWLRGLCHRFPSPVAVLDLGCGTGRFFSSLTNVRELVGVDASAPMLSLARTRLDESGWPGTLVHADLRTVQFDARRFDVVYSIGVLAEHVALTSEIALSVRRWLTPGGIFAFTTVHPESPSIPMTLKRRLGHTVMPLTTGAVQRWLRDRWLGRGLYADEAYIEATVGAAGFRTDSLTRFTSEAHLHCLVTARAA